MVEPLVKLPTRDRHRSHHLGVKKARMKYHHNGISAMIRNSWFPSLPTRASCQTKFAKGCLAIITDPENAPTVRKIDSIVSFKVHDRNSTPLQALFKDSKSDNYRSAQNKKHAEWTSGDQLSLLNFIDMLNVTTSLLDHRPKEIASLLEL